MDTDSMSGDRELSVVLPTFNERASLERLDPELVQALQGRDAEVVVVDDSSPDGTANFVRTVRAPVPHRVLVRPRKMGLASAVMTGIAAARGRVVVVMDADGSHDPRVIPEMVGPILRGQAEFVLGSRWVVGGSSLGLQGSRRIVSLGAELLARPLVRVTDPMSGYFAVRRDVVGRAPLSPRGFKIALEILARCRPHPIAEVPFEFRPRYAGASKLGGKEVRQYVVQLLSLYRARWVAPRTASRTR